MGLRVPTWLGKCRSRNSVTRRKIAGLPRSKLLEKRWPVREWFVARHSTVQHPLNLWRSGGIKLSMKALEQEYTELLNEYRIALRLWSEVRALYSPDQPEVKAATDHVEALERQLGAPSQPALAA